MAGHGVDGVAVAEAAHATGAEARDRILVTGAITSRVVDAAQRAAEQITAPVRTNIEVYEYRILAADASLTEIYQNSDVIITVEEHSIWVGLAVQLSSRSALSGGVRRYL